MKILVVEDEPKAAAYLTNGLSENGFVVDVSGQGDDGLHLALTESYDLVILDVLLPGRDGWSVLSSLRAAGKSTPVLFLTARDAVHDRVKGLELGADDYLWPGAAACPIPDLPLNLGRGEPRGREASLASYSRADPGGTDFLALATTAVPSERGSCGVIRTTAVALALVLLSANDPRQVTQSGRGAYEASLTATREGFAVAAAADEEQDRFADSGDQTVR